MGIFNFCFLFCFDIRFLNYMLNIKRQCFTLVSLCVDLHSVQFDWLNYGCPLFSLVSSTEVQLEAFSFHAILTKKGDLGKNSLQLCPEAHQGGKLATATTGQIWKWLVHFRHKMLISYWVAGELKHFTVSGCFKKWISHPEAHPWQNISNVSCVRPTCVMSVVKSKKETSCIKWLDHLDLLWHFNLKYAL